MNDFPVCVPKSYCKILTNETIGINIKVIYESTMIGENGEKVIPNGKVAQFVCRDSDFNKNKKTVFQLHGISRILCRNGEWHGLSDEEKPNCLPKSSVVMASVTVSASKITIRLLSGISVVCLISIICLIAYMFIARKTRHKRKMKEIKTRIYANDYEVNYDNYEDYHQIYERTVNDYNYICYDLLEDNPLYSDNVSRDAERIKNNSIYSFNISEGI
jgi:hypothetical protein